MSDPNFILVPDSASGSYHYVELKLGRSLASLFRILELHCIAGCCGLDAYDIRAIHIASFLAQDVPEKRVAVLREEISSMLEEATDIYQSAPEKGRTFLYLVEPELTLPIEDVRTLAATLLTEIGRAEEIIAFSAQWEYR